MTIRVLSSSFEVKEEGPPRVVNCSQLCFDNWQWLVRTYQMIDDKIEHLRESRISIQAAVFWCEGRFRDMPVELIYHSRFPLPLKLKRNREDYTSIFDPSGWDLVGISERNQDAQNTSDSINLEEYLFGSGNQYVLLISQRGHERGESASRIQTKTPEEAAEWCCDHIYFVPQELQRYVEHRLILPPGTMPDETDGQDLNANDNCSHLELQEAQDYSNSDQERDDWLLDLRGLEEDPRFSLKQLAFLLAFEGPKRQWYIVEQSAVRDCLIRAYKRRTGGTWPFHSRGYKPINDGTMF